MKPFKKGKRGLIFLKRTSVIKTPNPSSEAKHRVEIEAEFLKKLNELNIGPKFIVYKNSQLEMEYIKGEELEPFLKNHTKKEVIKLLKEVLKQCRALDKIKINKEEMHHPWKHIIIKDNQPVMIDFERCHYTEKPKNVSQFVQFVTSTRVSLILEEKNIQVEKTIREKVKTYKESQKEQDFKEILKCIS